MCFARAAMTPGDSLPTDPDALRALLLAERMHHAEELERLTAIIRELQRHRFGRRAERLDPEQLALALEDVEQTLAAADATAENDSTARKQVTPRRRQINRGALPPHLPREEIIIDIADKTCACCGGLKHRIGEDVSERLDVMPAQFKVIVTRRPKYACQACAGEVVQAPAPERLIENGIPTEALVAHVLIAKYADHTPLYRQAQIYARQGITLDRSTLADWVGRAAFTLRPVHTRLLEQLKQSTKLLRRDHGAGARSRARARQERAALGLCARRAALGRPRSARRCLRLCARPQACAAGRASRRLPRHLAGRWLRRLCELAQHGDVALAFCWSHVRRQFYEIQVKTPAPIATQALVRIAALYAIEADIRGLSADERRQARQRRAKPLIDDLRLWLEAQLAAVSGKATIAGAIRYTLSRWDGLTRFLDDGRIEIDSNVVERAIRPIALGRKNHLFAGSDGGGEHWAVIASLIETCKMNGVDPQAYLRDVLARIVARHPMGRIDELLPFAYVSAADKAAA